MCGSCLFSLASSTEPCKVLSFRFSSPFFHPSVTLVSTFDAKITLFFALVNSFFEENSKKFLFPIIAKENRLFLWPCMHAIQAFFCFCLVWTIRFFCVFLDVFCRNFLQKFFDHKFFLTARKPVDNSRDPVENFLWITVPDAVENFLWINIGILLKSLCKSYPQPGIPAGLSTGAGARATHPLQHPQSKKDPRHSDKTKNQEKNKKALILTKKYVNIHTENDRRYMK